LDSHKYFIVHIRLSVDVEGPLIEFDREVGDRSEVMSEAGPLSFDQGFNQLGRTGIGHLGSVSMSRKIDGEPPFPSFIMIAGKPLDSRGLPERGSTPGGMGFAVTPSHSSLPEAERTAKYGSGHGPGIFALLDFRTKQGSLDQVS
jgi:hypothetical protein